MCKAPRRPMWELLLCWKIIFCATRSRTALAFSLLPAFLHSQTQYWSCLFCASWGVDVPTELHFKLGNKYADSVRSKTKSNAEQNKTWRIKKRFSNSKWIWESFFLILQSRERFSLLKVFLHFQLHLCVRALHIGKHGGEMEKKISDWICLKYAEVCGGTSTLRLMDESAFPAGTTRGYCLQCDELHLIGLFVFFSWEKTLAQQPSLRANMMNQRLPSKWQSGACRRRHRRTRTACNKHASHCLMLKKKKTVRKS